MLTEQDYRNALVTRHPFWQALSPTTVKQRVDQILSAPNAEHLVQTLSPIEYTILLKETPELRTQLLQLAQPQQIRLVLDLDCWDRDVIQTQSVLEWIEDLQRSGAEVFAQTLQELDPEFLVFFLRQLVRIQGALPSEEDTEPVHYDEALTNELYRTEFIDPQNPLNDRLQRVLSFLRLADLDLYHKLMQAAMWEQDSELMEWAYRWRSGRLQDEGFPDYYDALESYRPVDLDQLAPAVAGSLQMPAPPESAEDSGLVPTYAWSFTTSGSLLDQALSYDFPVDTLERFCWEMVILCNRELVYDQVDFADAAAVRSSLNRVHVYLNIGLEYLSGGDVQQLPRLMLQHHLQMIFRVGLTLVTHLHQRAHQIYYHLTRTAGVRRMLSGSAHAVLTGLLQRQPQFFEGLTQPAAIGYRDFASLQDVVCIDPILQQIETAPAYGLTPRPE
jgi:hypothetical protein